MAVDFSYIDYRALYEGHSREELSHIYFLGRIQGGFDGFSDSDLPEGYYTSSAALDLLRVKCEDNYPEELVRSVEGFLSSFRSIVQS